MMKKFSDFVRNSVVNEERSARFCAVGFFTSKINANKKVFQNKLEALIEKWGGRILSDGITLGNSVVEIEFAIDAEDGFERSFSADMAMFKQLATNTDFYEI